MTNKSAPAMVLFRRDLRIRDNGALAAAAASGKPVIALFILDETKPELRTMGAASRWWLHHSLTALHKNLGRLGIHLVLRQGPTVDTVKEAVTVSGSDCILWNRRYAPSEAAVDFDLMMTVKGLGASAQSFDGALLHEPLSLKTGSGGFYKVYTPFWRALEERPEPRDPVDVPGPLKTWGGRLDGSALEDLRLLPRAPDWAGELVERWTPGEESGHRTLSTFVNEAVESYAARRDLPGESGSSKLSPHLAFGEITPFQILAALRKSRGGDGAAKFRKEIAWREFCYHVLFHNPHLHKRNFRQEFDGFAWRRDASSLRDWQRGMTGYPIVDAGMRELWNTGWMHNRVRMIVASFLVKDLLIDWREGEQWFWDTLVDADAANNAANWQWVAGSGADAAPYFRIFNPVLQGEKFDANGAYVRRFVPELAGLPDRYLHKPWDAPTAVLNRAGVTLGENYPNPIVDHAVARNRALAAYHNI